MCLYKNGIYFKTNRHLSSPPEGRLSHLQVLQMSKAAVNIGVRAFCGHTFSIPSVSAKDAIAGSYSKNRFSFVRNHQTLFESG